MIIQGTGTDFSCVTSPLEGRAGAQSTRKGCRRQSWSTAHGDFGQSRAPT